MEIKQGDVVLCEFYFTNLKAAKHRPVLVLKDNLPFNDFVAIPISSQTNKLQRDEYVITKDKFASGSIPKTSKIILRKTFVVSKDVVLKKYGSLQQIEFNKYHKLFCQYFNCCA